MSITVTVVTINMQILDLFFGFANINPLLNSISKFLYPHKNSKKYPERLYRYNLFGYFS